MIWSYWQLSTFSAEGNATSSSPPAPGDHVFACPWVNYGNMWPLSDWVEGHISGCLVTFLHFQLLNQDSASLFRKSPCTAARTQNVRQLLLSPRHLTRDPGSAPGEVEEKLRIKKGKISKGTWHWNSLASWMLTRSHLWVEEALSLALCQSPLKNINIYSYSQRISRSTPATWDLMAVWTALLTSVFCSCWLANPPAKGTFDQSSWEGSRAQESSWYW